MLLLFAFLAQHFQVLCHLFTRQSCFSNLFKENWEDKTLMQKEKKTLLYLSCVGLGRKGFYCLRHVTTAIKMLGHVVLVCVKYSGKEFNYLFIVQIVDARIRVNHQ